MKTHSIISVKGKSWPQRIIRITIALIMIVTLFPLAGCFFPLGPSDPPSFRYQGDRPELYTVATNSILGLYDEFSCSISVYEEDDYGRTLFVYYGSSTADDTEFGGTEYRFVAILISQKSDGDVVFYYPDTNLLLYPHSGETEFLVESKNAEIELLKEKNDWGLPVIDEKCIKIEVSDVGNNLDSTAITDEDMEKAYSTVAPENEYANLYFEFLTTNGDGYIFFFRTADESGAFLDSYIVMFNSDGTFDPDKGIMQIDDVWDYQDDIKEFKERNGW